MAAAAAVALVMLLTSRKTWTDAAVLLAANLAMFAAGAWVFNALGYVRLLGLPHLVFWIPMVAWFVWRLRTADIGQPYRAVLWLLVAMFSASLAIDAVDVVRYLLGERAPLAFFVLNSA